jgi:hypothetical protein
MGRRIKVICSFCASDVLYVAGEFGAVTASAVHFFRVRRAFEFKVSERRPFEGFNAPVVFTLTTAQPGMVPKPAVYLFNVLS